MEKSMNKFTSSESAGSGTRGSKAIWDSQSVEIFCDLCIKEVEQGHRPGTHFTKVGWDNLVKNFNKATGKEYNKVQLKNRWDTLKNDWKLWRDLVGKETGLGWNAKLKTIDASEEWWHRKLQVHHNAAKFRREGIDPAMMDKLDRMFMNITATGDHAWAPSSGVLPSDSSNTDTILLESTADSDDSIPVDVTQLDKDVFFRLCNDLETNYGLRGSRRMNVIEILGIFLHILGHGVGNRLVQERFQHSGETMSRYFSQVLDVVCRMAMDIIKPQDSDFRDIPEEILTDSRYMPHFKDCIGAIDGTHIHASISPEDQIPYIGRKGIPTQNVMAACDFNMQFTFAVAGWEGTAHDSRIFQTAIRDPALNFPNFPKPPKGKYYLVDAGYPQMSGYLGPYKGERYHIPDFRRGRQPTGPREVFNQAHSSLRSVIERTFGVWKKKWKILKTMPNFSFDKQVKIVIATMALHNYIKRHAQRDRHFEESKNYQNEGTEEEMDEENHEINGPGAQEIEVIRNQITASLMGD